MAAAALKCFILATLVTLAYSWTLEATHNSIIPGLTSNVILRCFDDRNISSQADIFVNPVTRVRLLKHSAVSETWVTFAEIIVPLTSHVSLNSADTSFLTPSGHLGDMGDSFLEIDWSIANEVSVGSYKCEVDGFLAKDGTDFHAITSVVNVTSLTASWTASGQLHILKQLITKMKQMATKMTDMEEWHRMEIENLKKDIGNVSALGSLQSIEEIKSMIRDNYFETRHWPPGNFSLPAPASGCPDSPFSAMKAGSITIEHRSNSPPSTQASPNSHLSKSFFKRHGQQNTLMFSYCNRTSPAGAQSFLSWPSGSYCIRPPTNRKCPPGFLLGDINFNLESPSQDITLDNAPYIKTFTNGFIDFSYCCRNDRGPQVPIALPSATPFYLYRYTGTCQKVLNMDATEEWFRIGTDPKENDHYDFAPVHPDSSLNHVEVHLCYYHKKS